VLPRCGAGGGQYQNGLVNYRGATIQMAQFNTEAVVPFFVSTRGYGLYWDNYAWSWLNPVHDEEEVHGWTSGGMMTAWW
jgi:alpha-D-xyloside xylohydrolase